MRSQNCRRRRNKSTKKHWRPRHRVATKTRRSRGGMLSVQHRNNCSAFTGEVIVRITPLLDAIGHIVADIASTVRDEGGNVDAVMNAVGAALTAARNHEGNSSARIIAECTTRAFTILTRSLQHQSSAPLDKIEAIRIERLAFLNEINIDPPQPDWQDIELCKRAYALAINRFAVAKLEKMMQLRRNPEDSVFG